MASAARRQCLRANNLGTLISGLGLLWRSILGDRASPLCMNISLIRSVIGHWSRKICRTISNARKHLLGISIIAPRPAHFPQELSQRESGLCRTTPVCDHWCEHASSDGDLPHRAHRLATDLSILNGPRTNTAVFATIHCSVLSLAFKNITATSRDATDFPNPMIPTDPSAEAS